MAKVGTVAILLCVLSLGAHRAFAQFNLLDPSKLLTPQTLTLVDLPGLVVTVRTEPKTLDVVSILTGQKPPVKLTFTQSTAGTFVPPVSVSSSVEVPQNALNNVRELYSRIPGLSQVLGAFEVASQLPFITPKTTVHESSFGGLSDLFPFWPFDAPASTSESEAEPTPNPMLLLQKLPRPVPPNLRLLPPGPEVQRLSANPDEAEGKESRIMTAGSEF